MHGVVLLALSHLGAALADLWVPFGRLVRSSGLDAGYCRSGSFLAIAATQPEFPFLLGHVCGGPGRVVLGAAVSPQKTFLCVYAAPELAATWR